VPADSIYELRCDPALTRLGLVKATDFHSRSKPVDELVTLSHCYAAVNGGYFGEKEEPLGYQRDWRGAVCSGVATGAVFGGIFVVGPKGPDLLGRDNFSPGPYSFAIQCGPRLIVKSSKVPGIHADPARRRTGIGYDHQGRVLLYATGQTTLMSFAECQAWLTGPADRGGLDPVGVLNLDGGSSTQFSIHTRELSQDVAGLTPVPVAVGVFPR
jgi:uncharacterized protein YigE (DUF2233 family)